VNVEGGMRAWAAVGRPMVAELGPAPFNPTQPNPAPRVL
jgi:hypothetical protein